MLLPAEFISLAEESGHIVPLGHAVLLQACQQAAQWCDADPSIRLLMSVNLASRQVTEPGIVDDIRRVLSETGWPAELLQLELTESAVMGSSPESLMALRALADLGVRIAIDDFGTGYSNLAYLRHLPVHTLKLAGTFVTSELSGQPHVVDVEVVGMLVQLAHMLGLSITAESVETEGQFNQLRELGCDTGQGWYFAPSLPPEQIPALFHLAPRPQRRQTTTQPPRNASPPGISPQQA